MATQPAFTPGPWRIEADKTDDEIRIVGKPIWPATRFGVKGEWDVCKVELDTNDTEANARLIAAAPDLLEAARFALDFVELIQDEQGRGPLTSKIATGLRAAIAKAAGAQ